MTEALPLAVAAVGTLGWLGAFALLLVVALAVAAAAHRHTRATEALVAAEGPAWRALAGRLGLEVRSIRALRGTWRGREVTVERTPAGLVVALRTVHESLGLGPTPLPVPTGDPVFDARFPMTWSPEHPGVVAAEVRRWLASAPEGPEIRAFRGRLQRTLPDTPDAVEPALHGLLALAEALDAAAARTDRERLQPTEPARVREALVARLDPVRDADLLRDRLGDPEARVAARAAIALADAPTLGRVLADPALEADLRYAARRAVPDSSIPEVVARLVRSPDPGVWLDAAHLAAHRPTVHASRALLGLLRPDGLDLATWRPDSEARRRLALRLARALEAAPCEGATEALIALLATDPARHVDALCLRHIEAHASVDHVQALRGLDDALGRDQRAHVARIVGRIQADSGAEAGRVALAEAPAQAGALALTEGPHG